MKPQNIDLTTSEWKEPSELADSINEYIYDTYGAVPSSYCLEVKLTNIYWED